MLDGTITSSPSPTPIATSDRCSASSPDATPTQWAAPVYSALGATLTGHAIVYYLVQRYPVSLTTPLLMISPIMAIFIGILLYGEEPGWKLWVGAAMTLSGIGVIHARLRGRRRPPRPL